MPSGVYKKKINSLTYLSEKRKAHLSKIRALPMTEKKLKAVTKTIIKAGKEFRKNNPQHVKKFLDAGHKMPRTQKQLETALINCGNSRKNIRGEFKSYKNKCEISFRSSYELYAYIKLEHDDFVKQYGLCHFSIPYIFKGESHRYIPDIMVEFINGDKIIIEVKPKCFINDIKILEKHEVLKNYCRENGMVCKFWTEEDIFIGVKK